MRTGDAVAARAKALVGVPFLLGGRDPADGLDCIGLAWLALGRRVDVPGGYRLRGGDPARWHRWFQRAEFMPVAAPAMPGDLCLVQVSPMHCHLLVAIADGYVHAHAGLRRIVLLPGEVPWPVDSLWRAPVTLHPPVEPAPL